MSYSEKLKDKRWQKRASEVRDRAGWICERCHTETNILLHVHHHFYLRGREPWEYDDDELSALCEKCHVHMEEARISVLKALGLRSLDELNDAIQMVARKLGPGEVPGCVSSSMQQFIFAMEGYAYGPQF